MVLIRRARSEESDTIAALHRHVAAVEWPHFAHLHTAEAHRVFYSDVVFSTCTIWAAVEAGRIVGFCAVRRGWIDHLFVAREHQGQGIGRALLGRTLQGRKRIRLWTFQRNKRSRDFYRQQGFSEVMFTDGAHNEEQEPDVMLEWVRR